MAGVLVILILALTILGLTSFIRISIALIWILILSGIYASIKDFTKGEPSSGLKTLGAVILLFIIFLIIK